VSLLATAGIPLAIGWLGRPDWGPILGGYVGSFLLGSFYVALGCWTSSLSENQIISMLIGIFLGVILTAVLSPNFANYVAAQNDPLARAIEGIGVVSHFDSIERGVIALSDVVYFVSGSLLFLALNVFTVEWKRY